MSSINGTCTDCSTDSCLITGFLYKTLWMEVDPTNVQQGTKFNGNVTVTGDFNIDGEFKFNDDLLVEGCVKTNCINDLNDPFNQITSSSNILLTPEKSPGNFDNPIRNFELVNRNLAICDAEGNGPVNYPTDTTDPRWGYSYMLVHGGSDFRDIVRIRKSQNYNSIYNQFGAALQITAPQQGIDEDVTIQLGRDFVSQNNAGIIAFKYAGNGSPLNTIRIDTNGNQASSTPSFVITMPPPPQLGNVGIHVAQPQYPLDIQGDTAIRNITTGNIVMYVDAANGDFTLNASDTTRMMYLDGNSTSFNIGKGSGTVQANNCIAIGINSGLLQADNCLAIGNNAGQAQGINSVAIGVDAGKNSQSSNAVALGVKAAETTQGASAVAIGYNAGQTSQGNHSVAIGFNSGVTSQGSESVAIGRTAGNSGQSNFCVAIGSSSAVTNQGQFAVAIGRNAGATDQSTNSVAIGTNAGSNTQGSSSVAIGNNAGQTTQSEFCTALGYNAGNTTQGSYAVALGYGAGLENQATQAVAVGGFAGRASQGNRATALGLNAGFTSQGSFSTAVGASAGFQNQQQYATAIGHNAGYTGQATYATALGVSAGETNQGENSVSIGYRAGYQNQHPNSIILNASGATLNSTAQNQFMVSNMRNDQLTATNSMTYNPTTKEITYETVSNEHPVMSLLSYDYSILYPNQTWYGVIYTSIYHGDFSTSTTGTNIFTNTRLGLKHELGNFINISGKTLSVNVNSNVAFRKNSLTGERHLRIALYNSTGILLGTLGESAIIYNLWSPGPVQDLVRGTSACFSLPPGFIFQVQIWQNQGNSIEIEYSKTQIIVL